jgi:hypothetical protein
MTKHLCLATVKRIFLDSIADNLRKGKIYQSLKSLQQRALDNKANKGICLPLQL